MNALLEFSAEPRTAPRVRPRHSSVRARRRPTGHTRCTPDLDLVDRLVAHEDAAFVELVLAHGPRMLAVAMRYLRSRVDAEDAVQDAFVNVVRSIANFNRGSRLGTWLHRIVVNCALMSLRRRKRKPFVPLAGAVLETEAGSARRTSRIAKAEQALTRRELGSILHEAIDLLPAEQRAVLLLRDVEELSLAEISALLHQRLATVKARLLGAHRALRIALRGQVTP